MSEKQEDQDRLEEKGTAPTAIPQLESDPEEAARRVVQTLRGELPANESDQSDQEDKPQPEATVPPRQHDASLGDLVQKHYDPTTDSVPETERKLE